MKDSELIKQSLEFSVCIVEYYKLLVYEMKEYVISKQLLRSGTSIGANIHEANYAVSKADFFKLGEFLPQLFILHSYLLTNW